MDNSFEEQFSQKVRATAPVQPAKIKSNNESRLPLIISAILAAIVLFESIALVITLVNYFDTFSSGGEVIEEDAIDDSNYAVDDKGQVVAFNSTCKNPETGAYYTFSTSNIYREYDSTSSLVGSGTYSVERYSIIKFKDTASNKPNLFYDGFILTDGYTIYECEEPEPTPDNTN